MKAISLWQPWASLIAFGVKPYETRDWAPPSALIGQRIAIHAAKRPPEKLPQLSGEIEAVLGRGYALPLGAVVCTARLVAAFQCGLPAKGTAFPSVEVRRAMASRPFPKCFTVRIDEFGDYAPGRWAWLLGEVKRLDPPVPARGAQGFWEWADAAQVEAAS